MTASSSKLDLPPHWVVKTSRRNPSLSFYANIKTGQSTWTHPSLLKEDELKPSPKKKRAKKKMKLQENNSKFSNTTTTETAEHGSGVEGETAQCSTPMRAKVGLLTKESCISLNSQESKQNESGSITKPLKFTIKKKENVMFTSPKEKNSTEKQDKVHPSIVLFKKIYSRAGWPKIPNKKVHNDKEDKDNEQNINNRGKKTETEEKTNKLLAVGPKTHTSSQPDDKFKHERKHALHDESGRKIIKPKRKQKKSKADEDQNVIDDIIKELTASPPKEKNDDSLEVRNERKSKIKESKMKEIEMYRRFEKSARCSSRSNKSSQLDVDFRKVLPNSDKDHHIVAQSECIRENTDKQRNKALGDESKPHIEPEHDTQYINKATASEPEPAALPSEEVYVEASEMEIDEQEVMLEIANFRGSVGYSRTATCTSLPVSETCHSSASVYFVVDTNILISDIKFLEQLKSTMIGGRETVLVIPYTAVQEMDGLKKSTSIGKACQEAIRWCNRHFEKRDPRVQGQSYSTYCTTREKSKNACADDLMRDYCLLLARDGLDVCLLTNDVNLRNKAMMSSLTAIGIENLRSKLGNTNQQCIPSPIPPQATPKCEMSVLSVSLGDTKMQPQHIQEAAGDVDEKQCRSKLSKRARRSSSSQSSEDNILLERITSSLHHTLGNILQYIMKEVFEDLWFAIIKHKPPWSLEEVFACWEKHWIAVMIDRFPRNMRDLLTDIKEIVITMKGGDIQALLRKVQLLYSYFEEEPYCRHVLPVQGNCPPVMDMSEASPAMPIECAVNSTTPVSQLPSAFSGVTNIEKMINQVGAHITHFIALVLNAYGVQHSLPTISASASLTPEDARTSGINLHKVTMSLGTTITRCLNERTSSAFQELGHLLINFWAEAKLPCPHLPFMESDLSRFVENPCGQQYLQCVLKELESLVHNLASVL